ncbi:MAG: leucine-rich repeat domain-containing protein [Bacteroidales bacterium]|jgi:hypothetical protein|nr:leucine-rich repeat domain-containing protein [Bacteroidales bacterium]
MKKLFLLAILFIVSSFAIISAQLVVICDTAGKLNNAVNALTTNYVAVNSVEISGVMNAVDFKFLRTNFNHIQSLNLSGVSIVAYSGTGGTNINPMGTGDGTIATSYKADTLPNYAFYKPAGTTAMQKFSNLISLILPATLKGIESYALNYVGGLSMLDLSGYAALTYIGDYAFSQSEVSDIILPTNIQQLGTSIFSDCANLSNIIFAEPANIITLPDYLFSKLTSLSSVKIPSSVVNISNMTFLYFRGDSITVSTENNHFAAYDGALYTLSSGRDGQYDELIAVPLSKTTLNIPEGVKKICSNTLASNVINGDIAQIETLHLPSSVQIIDNKAFLECAKLKKVTINSPSQLDSIGSNAFAHCYNLRHFEFGTAIRAIGNSAFITSQIDTLIFPNTLQNIGYQLFSNDTALKYVDLSNTSLTELKAGIFKFCNQLNCVLLPQNLQIIAYESFASCDSLHTINLPNTVKTLDERAFGWSGLNQITLPESIISIGKDCFNNCFLPGVFIPQNVSAIGTNAFFTANNDIVVDEQNPYFSSENGILYNKTKSKAIFSPSHISSNLILPETVDTIAEYCFYSNIQLKSIEIPQGIKFIANYVFQNDSLESIKIKNPNPCEVQADAFYTNNNFITNNTKLIVPRGRLSAYQSAQYWNNFQHIEESVEGNALYDLGYGYANSVSPDGKYVVGFDNNFGGFLWINGDAASIHIPNSYEIVDVNDSCIMTGVFYDSTYMVTDVVEGIIPLKNGGVYRNNRWYSLGRGRYTAASDSPEIKADVNAITADGKIVGESQNYPFNGVIPFTWTYNENFDDYLHDTLAYVLPIAAGVQGGRFKDISSDGQVACGWYADPLGMWHSVVWTSSDSYKVLDANNWSVAGNVSANGRYVAFEKDNRAAIYDVQNDKIRTIGDVGSRATAVSDNCIVVGYTKTGTRRQAFVWSDDFGFMTFRTFLDYFAPDVTFDPEFEDYFSFDPNGGQLDVPMAISADGKVIAGWSGYSTIARRTWVLTLDEYRDILARPTKLEVSVDLEQRNVVNLSWDSPTGYGSHNLDFYKIFRNGEQIKMLDAWDGTTYVDENVPAGYNKYNVMAIYDYSNINGVENYLSSGISDAAYASIVNSYELPFVEDFESRSLNSNFWTRESSDGYDNAWKVALYNGYDNPLGTYLLFTATGNQEITQSAVISKPLDGRNVSHITLSYIYRVVSNVTTFVGKKDTVFLEVSNDINGSNWQIADTKVIAASENDHWYCYSKDISQYATGHFFKVRLRYSAGQNRNQFYIKIDNLGIGTDINTAPSDVIAVKYSGNVNHVYWKDPNGSYGLTYANSEPFATIGNRGVTFFGVNQFDSEDLKPFKNKYITSVSAYINQYSDEVLPIVLKIAVFENDLRIVEQDIPSFIPNQWNTFVLENPVLIDAQNNIKIGIEVVQHEAMPLVMDYGENYNQKGNLWSDDGVNWYQIDEYMYDEETPMTFDWCIIANVRDENTASVNDRRAYIAGYEIYRDGVKITPEIFNNQHFTDIVTGVDHCYKIKAFGLTSGMSDLSVEGCVTDYSAVLDYLTDNGSLSVYPNPVKTELFVTKLGQNSNKMETKLEIYDVSGKLQLSQPCHNLVTPINVVDLKPGTYFLKIGSEEVKFVKK